MRGGRLVAVAAAVLLVALGAPAVAATDPATPAVSERVHRCPHTMTDPARAACLRDRYRANHYGQTRLRAARMPARYRHLLTAAVHRYRATHRDPIGMRALSDSDWMRRITADTECAVVNLKMGCVSQAKLDHRDDWEYIGKMSLVCGTGAWVAVRHGGSPMVVGGEALGLCIFQTLVWAL